MGLFKCGSNKEKVVEKSILPTDQPKATELKPTLAKAEEVRAIEAAQTAAVAAIPDSNEHITQEIKQDKKLRKKTTTVVDGASEYETESEIDVDGTASLPSAASQNNVVVPVTATTAATTNDLTVVVASVAAATAAATLATVAAASTDEPSAPAADEETSTANDDEKAEVEEEDATEDVSIDGEDKEVVCFC